MKRRRFLKAIAATPAVPALVAQQTAPPGRGGGGRGAQEVAHIELAEAAEFAEPVSKFFSAQEFAALKKLSGLLVPPVAGNIGALDCDAPEFLDFLISVSPPDRQALYRNGLVALNTQARRQFGKLFAELDAAQADKILQPLLTPVAWAYDPPKDPVKHFIYAAQQDIRTATRNSLEASTAGASSGRRGFSGAGLYWNPVDPV